jgi:hypothetical protein
MKTPDRVAKIKKSKLFVFFEFVGPVSGQKHDGDVGLPAFDTGEGMWIKGRFGHGPANVIESFGGVHEHAPDKVVYGS